MIFAADVLVIKLFGHSEKWVMEFVDYTFTIGIEVFLIVLFLIVAWRSFAGRLKGFGLRFSMVGKDFGMAAVNLVTALPMVMIALIAVDYFGRVSVGPEFKIETNEGLRVITESPKPFMQVVMVLFTVGVVPVFEEFLFRGMIQSMFRGFLSRPWPAILLTSVLFAMLHPSTHWPALFILSMCMGYAYEKSGSIIRAIFVHAMFNAASVTAALTG